MCVCVCVNIESMIDAHVDVDTNAHTSVTSEQNFRSKMSNIVLAMSTQDHCDRFIDYQFIMFTNKFFRSLLVKLVSLFYIRY